MLPRIDLCSLGRHVVWQARLVAGTSSGSHVYGLGLGLVQSFGRLGTVLSRFMRSCPYFQHIEACRLSSPTAHLIQCP